MNELELIVERCKSDVERIGGNFDEVDDDWLPALLIHSRDDTWTIAGIDPEFMANEITKDLLAEEVMPDLIRQSNAISCAFICSTWQKRYMGPDDPRPKPGEPGYTMPSEDPDRIEAVMIQAMTAIDVKLVTAQIQRHPDAPPTLMDWAVMGESDAPEQPTVEGRFVTPLRQALAPQG